MKQNKKPKTFAEIKQAIYGCACGCHGPTCEVDACKEDCCAHPNESVLLFSYSEEDGRVEPAPHLHPNVHKRFKAL